MEAPWALQRTGEKAHVPGHIFPCYATLPLLFGPKGIIGTSTDQEDGRPKIPFLKHQDHVGLLRKYLPSL